MKNNRAFFLLCLSLSVILGLLVRIPYFLIYDFALNDGALFVQMSDAIRSNDYILPATVVYNRTEIPFAYPPLSFYFVALITDLFRLNILDVVRYMPLFFNILSICIFVLLASRLIKNQVIFLYTCLFFPLMPRSYEWLIMGGGVTRSVGCFFALLAAYQATYILTKSDIRPFIYCLLFLSLTALSHLEWGITGVVTVSLIILSKQFSKRRVGLIIALGVVVLVLTSPWWITIIARHGLYPFTAASKTSEWYLFKFENIPLAWIMFDDGLGGPLSVLALIGCYLSFAKKDWFLPVWLFAIFVTTPRHGPTPAAMPLAILASMGLAQFLIPSLMQVALFIKNRFNYAKMATMPRNKFPQRLLPSWVVFSGVVAVICILILNGTYYAAHTPLAALTGSERSAMTWIKHNTPDKSQFIVLSKSLSWDDARVAEWFPVLADRKSLTTAQGLEWIPGNVFLSKVESILKLKQHQLEDNALVKYVESQDDSFQYVAVFIPHIAPNYGGFVESGKYRTVYATNSVVVFGKHEPHV